MRVWLRAWWQRWRWPSPVRPEEDLDRVGTRNCPVPGPERGRLRICLECGYVHDCRKDHDQ